MQVKIASSARGTLMVAALGAMLSACGSTPSASLPQTPAPRGDIREQVVAALQQPGKIARVRIVIDEPNGPEGQEYATVAWLDLPQRRARIEQWRGREVTNVTILAPDISVGYMRDMNALDEFPFSLPSEIVHRIPASLNNPSLMATYPLAAALWYSEWRPAGNGDWEGKPATLWEADHPGPEEPMHSYATIYLDAESYPPLGQKISTSERKGEPTSGSYSVSYEIWFVPPEMLPDRAFEVESLRALKAEFGGKLEEAKQLGFIALWLGQAAQLDQGYPALPLDNIDLRRSDDPRGAFVGFYYGNSSRPPDQQGEIHILVYPPSVWERTIKQHADDAAWWREPNVKREAVVIDGISAEYAIGHPRSPELARTSGSGRTPAVPISYLDTEMIVWLPDSVVRISAPRSPLPLRSPTPNPTSAD